MTIVYGDGTEVEALPLSFRGRVLRVAAEGYDDVRVFKCMEGVWRTEGGQTVQLRYSGHNDRPGPATEESHFICSAGVARQLIRNLMSEADTQDSFAQPFYVISAEERRVRVTVCR
jgi:hypothetical protein